MKKVSIVSKFGWKGHLPVWKTDSPSLTVPNRTLSLRQIADRFASGLTTIDEKVAMYDEGRVVIKDFEKLDLTERMEIVRDAEERMREVIHKQQLAAKEKQQHALSLIVQKEVDRRMADIAASKVDNP